MRLLNVHTCLVLALLLLPAMVLASNENTTVVLHAVDAYPVDCHHTGGLDCESVGATVNVAGFATPAIFVTVWRYDDVRGFECAFDVSPTWTFVSSGWECQGGQISAFRPEPPFGPQYGTIMTAFNLITGGAVEVIGRMHFAAAGSGCVTVIDSIYPCAPAPGGVLIANAASECQAVAPPWGRVCVGPGGDPVGCEMMTTPVEQATWGRIKSQYR